MRTAILSIMILTIFLVGCAPQAPTQPAESREEETAPEPAIEPVQEIEDSLDEGSTLDEDLDDSDVQSIEDDLALIEEI